MLWFTNLHCIGLILRIHCLLIKIKINLQKVFPSSGFSSFRQNSFNLCFYFKLRKLRCSKSFILTFGFGSGPEVGNGTW